MTTTLEELKPHPDPITVKVKFALLGPPTACSYFKQTGLFTIESKSGVGDNVKADSEEVLEHFIARTRFEPDFRLERAACPEPPVTDGLKRRTENEPTSRRA